MPNFYGITSSPLHRNLPTDRLLAEWHLDSKRTIAAINNLTPDPTEAPATIHIPNLQSTESSTSTLQSKIRSEFQSWFSKHYAATSLRFTPAGADYLLQPWSDF
jgi:predicted GNAT superfamily acetyltransferase